MLRLVIIWVIVLHVVRCHGPLWVLLYFSWWSALLVQYCLLTVLRYCYHLTYCIIPDIFLWCYLRFFIVAPVDSKSGILSFSKVASGLAGILWSCFGLFVSGSFLEITWMTYIFLDVVSYMYLMVLCHSTMCCVYTTKVKYLLVTPNIFLIFGKFV